MQKRLRVFAGPNGSGKSSIIQSILDMRLDDGRKLDFGTYINADDIAVILTSKILKFSQFGISLNELDFLDSAKVSGLVHSDFTLKRLKKCLIWKENALEINHQRASEVNDNPYERIAQLFSYVLREKLLELGMKISFETVFSHAGKIDFIRRHNPKVTKYTSISFRQNLQKSMFISLKKFVLRRMGTTCQKAK